VVWVTERQDSLDNHGSIRLFQNRRPTTSETATGHTDDRDRLVVVSLRSDFNLSLLLLFISRIG
jgi:hypothetical protein